MQPSLDADPLNMLPTEEELLTCDCPFCVAYRGRSGSGRSIVTGHPLVLSDVGSEYRGCTPQQYSVHSAVREHHGVICCYAQSNAGLTSCTNGFKLLQIYSKNTLPLLYKASVVLLSPRGFSAHTSCMHQSCLLSAAPTRRENGMIYTRSYWLSLTHNECLWTEPLQ